MASFDFDRIFWRSLPHLIINTLLCLYIIIGAYIFHQIDEKIAKEPFAETILFTFTTIATIGYGKMVPTNTTAQIFCIIYTTFGIPLIFLVLANIGQFFAECYWLLMTRVSKQTTKPDERKLPMSVVIFLLLNHTLVGGFLFHFGIDQMPFVPAIYFSFISITTIGFGDITPIASTYSQMLIVLAYLAFGMVLMSTFISSLSGYLRRIHYLGRSFHGAANVDVWFGGQRMTVTELLQVVAEQFMVSPEELQTVLRDLDNIIAECDPPNATNNHLSQTTTTEVQTIQHQKQLSIPLNCTTTTSEKMSLLTVPNHNLSPTTMSRSAPQSPSMRVAARRNDDALRALGLVYHITTHHGSARYRSKSPI